MLTINISNVELKQLEYQKKTDEKLEQAEFKARNEKKRAELEICKAKKEVKDRTESMKPIE